MQKPAWWTVQRGMVLAEASLAAGGRCKHGHFPCSGLDNPDHWIEWDAKPEIRSTSALKEGNKDGVPTGIFRRVWHPKVVINYEPRLAGKLELVQEALIGTWKQAELELAWLARQTMPTGEFGRFGGRFDPVSRDVFMAQRPDYYLVGHGVNAWTKKRVVVVRIPSTYIYLFVDLSKTSLSKNARRKIRRYGKWPAVPVDASLTEDKLVRLSVEHFWATVGR